MRNRSLFFAAGAVVLLAAHARAETLGDVTLGPGESRSYVIKASGEIKVGWSTDTELEQAKTCPRSLCVEMRGPGGGSMSSMFGGSMHFRPEHGRVSVTFKNLASFPIGISPYQEGGTAEQRSLPAEGAPPAAAEEDASSAGTKPAPSERKPRAPQWNGKSRL